MGEFFGFLAIFYLPNSAGLGANWSFSTATLALIENGSPSPMSEYGDVGSLSTLPEANWCPEWCPETDE